MITAVVFLDILGFVAIVAACAGMLYLANRIEPHWVAKDGQRFLTTAHELDQFGLPMGRKHEVRVHVDPDSDALVIRRRSIVRGGGSGVWCVHAKSPQPPRGREVYILKSVSDNAGATMALRFPRKSSMLPRMDELLAATGEDAERRRRQAVAGERPPGEPSYYPKDDEPTEAT